MGSSWSGTRGWGRDRRRSPSRRGHRRRRAETQSAARTEEQGRASPPILSRLAQARPRPGWRSRQGGRQGAATRPAVPVRSCRDGARPSLRRHAARRTERKWWQIARSHRIGRGKRDGIRRKPRQHFAKRVRPEAIGREDEAPCARAFLEHASGKALARTCHRGWRHLGGGKLCLEWCARIFRQARGNSPPRRASHWRSSPRADARPSAERLRSRAPRSRHR